MNYAGSIVIGLSAAFGTILYTKKFYPKMARSAQINNTTIAMIGAFSGSALYHLFSSVR